MSEEIYKPSSRPREGGNSSAEPEEYDFGLPDGEYEFDLREGEEYDFGRFNVSVEDYRRGKPPEGEYDFGRYNIPEGAPLNFGKKDRTGSTPSEDDEPTSPAPRPPEAK